MKRSMVRGLARFLNALLGLTLLSAGPSAMAAKVTFDSRGNTLVDGKPFFPIGLFTYSLDTTCIAEAHKLSFNTVSMLTEHHKPSQLDWVHREGLKALCPPGPEWVAAGTNHPAVLAWYLADEPEGHDQSPAMLRERYLALKAADPNHPVAIDHFMWDALIQYKDACDFTMTSVYPVLAARDTPLTHVGLFIDHARNQHHPNWPHWPYIQIFGGPNTDGGKWLQPEPAEVRCMVYIALAHRANGIFYFSYWPQAPKTWAEVGTLNREIRAMTPWLLAEGDEVEAKSSLSEVQVRAKSIRKGRSGLVLVVNTSAESKYVVITIPELPSKEMRGLFDKHTFKPVKHVFSEKMRPHDTRAYVWGKP